jgi:hypothetical protein
MSENRLTGQSTVPPSITPQGPGVLAPALDPHARLPLLRGGRPLKRWRYVALFAEELSACAALVQIGPARQSFWALHPRGGQAGARERTRLVPRRGELAIAAAAGPGSPGRLRIRDRGVELEVTLAEQVGIEATCPSGAQQVWTRKQAGVAARGTLALDGGARRPLEALAVIDDTAGYHARVTEWRWAAGVGRAPDGTPLAWNLVSGVNDPPRGSERAVWVAGEPREPPPVRFSEDLSGIRCEDGSELSFRAESERSRRDNLLVFASDYSAPFGTFSGTLPGGVELAHGQGVVEHHRARW